MIRNLLFILFPAILFSQVQVGQDIDGESANDQSGKAIALSADGSIIAISAKLNNGNGSDSGHVRVYGNQSGTWTQIGQDIDGEIIFDQSGDSVALSSDGTILAIGSTGNDGNGSQSGSARIFQYNGTDTWIQIGQDIDGFSANDEFGRAISLSADGNTVAISSIRHSNFRGHVRVYNYNGTDTWLQIGSDIDVAGTDQSGFSIQLSDDASRIIVGAVAFNSNQGVARVYENQAGTWTQIGQNIEGEADSDQAGFSVSISGNGTTIAIGAPFNNAGTNDKGHVRVYNYNGTDTWLQIGLDIDGENTTDRFGGAVSLNADGTVLAAGAVLAKSETDTNISQGHVRVFQNQSGTWTQVGSDMDGENPGDFFGESVSISDDGSIVAGGSLRNDNAIGNDAGHVRVFDLSSTLNTRDFEIDRISVYPNPASHIINIELANTSELKKVRIYNSLGQLVSEENTTTIDVSNYSKGLYIIEITTNKAKTTKKLILQ